MTDINYDESNNASTILGRGDFDYYGDAASEVDPESFWRSAVSYSMAAICLAVFLATMVFLFAAIKTRQFTYNLYIVFLLLPEAILNLILGIRCIYDGMRHGSSENELTPMFVCRLQQIGIAFYVSNVYLNAVVCKEIYYLVWNSYNRKRIPPPKVKKILLQVFLIYSLVGLFAAWLNAPINWAGITIENDPYCAASYGTEKMPGWVTLFAINVVVMPPVVYVVWVFHLVIRQKLLPLRGRTRALALYFSRILATFIFFYMPMTIIVVVYYYFPTDQKDSAAYFWLLIAFTLLNPLQNVVSLYIYWQKDDIQKAVYGFGSRLTIFSFSNLTTPTADNTLSTDRNSTNEWNREDVYDAIPGDEDEISIGEGDNDAEDGMSMWMSASLRPSRVEHAQQAETEMTPKDTKEERIRRVSAPTFPLNNPDPENNDNPVKSSWF